MRISVSSSASLFSEYDADIIFPEQPVHLIAQVVDATDTQFTDLIRKQRGEGQAFFLNSKKQWSLSNTVSSHMMIWACWRDK